MTGATNRWRAENINISFDASVLVSRRLYLQNLAHPREPSCA